MREMSSVLTILAAAGSVMAGSVMAGTLTTGTTPPTDYFASGPTNANQRTGGATRVFTYSGRGNVIKADSGSLEGYVMSALVLRKVDAQDFAGSTATLNLHVFEGTSDMWLLGDGQNDGDLFNGTGIATVHTETFALGGSYAHADYLTFTLDTPVVMASDMGFVLTYQQGNASVNSFRVALYYLSTALGLQDGYMLQANATSNAIVANAPWEYYAVGYWPDPATVVIVR